MTRKVALLAAILRLRLRVPGQYALGICAALVLVAGTSRAEDKDSDLRTLLEQQNKQIQVTPFVSFDNLAGVVVLELQ